MTRRWLSGRRTATPLTVTVAVIVAFSATVATTSASTPAEQVARLNAQRAAHGIPAGILERPDWSDACRKHEAYQDANGGELTHDEGSSSPGYTPEGAWAGANSILTSREEAFSAAGNAFEHAPIHLMQALGPELEQMGVWGGCATTWPGYTRTTATPTLYSYPGHGTSGHYFEETASENPYVPGDFVGLPQGTQTGPHLYVMAQGLPRGRLTSASLSGPSGGVEVRAVDNMTDGLGSYLPPGGIIIPVSPLAPRQVYTASATFEAGEGEPPLSRVWSFGTRGLSPASSLRAEGGHLLAATASPAPLSVVVQRVSDNGRVASRQLVNGETWVPALAEGAYVACLYQAPQGAYDGANECSQQFEVEKTFAAKLEVLRAGVRNGRLDVLADITGRADGDEIQVEFHARGKRHRFTAVARDRRLRIAERLPRSQRSARSGIVTLAYGGGEYQDSRVRPAVVRLRAASGKARLERGELSIAEGVLSAAGTVSRSARGVVRLRLTYDELGGGIGAWEGRATIDDGRWKVEEELPPAAHGGGYLTMQFTGYLRRNVRGEQTAKQVFAR